MHRFIYPVLIVVFILTTQACQSDKEKIKGHWHFVFPFGSKPIDTQETVDITDSLLITGLGSQIGPDTIVYLLENGKLSWFVADTGYDGPYLVTEDSLLIGENLKDPFRRLVRKPNCKIPHFFSYSYLDINLPFVNHAEKIDPVEYDLHYINIGKTKPHSKDMSDSISIQVNDVLIQYSDIPEFLKQEYQLHSPRFTSALYIDKNTSMHIVDRVKYEIASSGPEFSTVHLMSIQDTLQPNFYQGIGMILPRVCQHQAKHYRQPLPDSYLSYGYTLGGISKSTDCRNEAFLKNQILSSKPQKIIVIYPDSLKTFYYQKFNSNKEYKQAILEYSFDWKKASNKKLINEVENFIRDNRQEYIIILYYKGQTDYDTYIQMQSIVSQALYELRNEYALFYFHKPFDALTETEAEQVYTFYPKRMIEMSEVELLYLKEGLQ